MVNTPILIYKDVFDFLYLFDIVVKYNGNEILIDDGKILIQKGFKRFFLVLIGIIQIQIFSLLEMIFYRLGLYDFYE